MLMVFVKTRLNKEGNLVRTIWAIPWRADMKDHQAENESNLLGQKNLNITPLSDVGVLADLILSQPASLAKTFEQLWMKLENPEHRKEAIGFLCLRHCLKMTVEFLHGNQTVVDAIVNGVNEQGKTYTVAAHSANTCHRVNGFTGRCYTAADGVVLREFLVLRTADDRLWFFTATQTADALLSNGVFAHRGYKRKPACIGTKSINVQPGIFVRLFEGKKRERTQEHTDWLRTPAYGWRRPAEITPAMQALFPEGWLEEAAQDAADSDAFPSTAQLDQL